MSLNPETLLTPVIAVAEKASQEILKIYNSGFSVEQKDDRTPLTEADMAAHKTISEALEKLTPDIPVLSEESSHIPFSERSKWQRYWLVDPLDGTREFIKRNGEFTVNIALIDNHLPILGVIHVPVMGLCYYAAKNCGAFKLEPGQPPEKIHVKKVGPGKIFIAGSRSHRDTSLDNFLNNIGEHEMISMGSSLKSCLVAEGKVDIYPRLGPTSEWDTAAAQCVVEEAGGFLTTTDFQQLRYNTKESLLNPHFLVYGDKDYHWQSYFG